MRFMIYNVQARRMANTLHPRRTRKQRLHTRTYYRHYFIYQDYWSYNMYGHIRHYWKYLEPHHNLNLLYFGLLDWISINIFNYV